MPLGGRLRREGRREARREHREERKEHIPPAVKTAVVMGTGAGLGIAVARRAKAKRSGSPDSSSSSDEDDNAPKTFAMKEKLLAFGDSFTINRVSRRHQRGRPAYYANNKVMRLRETFHLQASRSGPTLYCIQDRKLRIRDSMAIEDADGRKVAEIKKKVIGIVRENFVVKIKDETNWQIHGSILEHDFTIKENGREIVKVHKNWIAPIRDCYFIDIHGTDDVPLALTVVIGLEAMSED
ncbi:unnamed protein product [Pseudo-nitzschia multistriata]|uniref:Tubby C-terminal domain-containing protein n=1 Tax=Pseudo-nitzschia multistriata TaxID=183589 RepID=A0A448Z2K9_9STRA|nr:unnamed protein product [Pseudo-nitzschia multistriata]